MNEKNSQNGQNGDAEKNSGGSGSSGSGRKIVARKKNVRVELIKDSDQNGSESEADAAKAVEAPPRDDATDQDGGATDESASAADQTTDRKSPDDNGGSGDGSGGDEKGRRSRSGGKRKRSSRSNKRDDSATEASSSRQHNDYVGRDHGKNGNDKSLSINELTRMNMRDLRGIATRLGISQENLIALKKQEVIFAVLKAHTERNGTIYAYGSLEILPDGYG
ncbi:MAG: Rho termination factor N-terminal domain-containing protein, partial [Spirochaetota bacterium]